MKKRFQLPGDGMQPPDLNDLSSLEREVYRAVQGLEQITPKAVFPGRDKEGRDRRQALRRLAEKGYLRQHPDFPDGVDVYAPPPPAVDERFPSVKRAKEQAAREAVFSIEQQTPDAPGFQFHDGASFVASLKARMEAIGSKTLPYQARNGRMLEIRDLPEGGFEVRDLRTGQTADCVDEESINRFITGLEEEADLPGPAITTSDTVIKRIDGMTSLISIQFIKDNPWQTRRNYKEEKVREIALSLSENIDRHPEEERGLHEIPKGRLVDQEGRGLNPDQFDKMKMVAGEQFVQLAFGHTRLRAFRLMIEGFSVEQTGEAGKLGKVRANADPRFSVMPVRVDSITNFDMAKWAAEENSKRSDPGWFETGCAIQKRLDDFEVTQTEIGKHFGLNTQASVSHYVRAARALNDFGDEYLITLAENEELPLKHVLVMIAALKDFPKQMKTFISKGRLKDAEGNIISAADLDSAVKQLVDENTPGEIIQLGPDWNPVPGLNWHQRLLNHWNKFEKEQKRSPVLAMQVAGKGGMFLILTDYKENIIWSALKGEDRFVKKNFFSPPINRYGVVYVGDEKDLGVLAEQRFTVGIYRELEGEAADYVSRIISPPKPEPPKDAPKPKAEVKSEPAWLVAYRKLVAAHPDQPILYAVGAGKNVLVALEKYAYDLGSGLKHRGHANTPGSFSKFSVHALKLSRLHQPTMDWLTETYPGHVVEDCDDPDFKQFVDQVITTTAEYRPPLSDAEKEAVVKEQLGNIFPGPGGINRPAPAPAPPVLPQDPQTAGVGDQGRTDMLSHRLETARMYFEMALIEIQQAKEYAEEEGNDPDAAIAAYLESAATTATKAVKDMLAVSSDPATLESLRSQVRSEDLALARDTLRRAYTNLAWSSRPEKQPVDPRQATSGRPSLIEEDAA
jgi:hypothetical protein